MTSWEGRIAALAAAEFGPNAGRLVLTLAGGMQNWVTERLEFRSGVDQPAPVRCRAFDRE